MKIILFFIATTVCILSAVLAQEKKAPAGVNIRVTVEGLRNRKGQLLAACFTAPKGFPSGNKHAYQTVATNITSQPLQLVFTNVPAGSCAIGISHDENSNGMMDTRSFGRPEEGYGVSGKPVERLGPPRFKDCALPVASTNMSVIIRVIYPDK